MGRLALLGIRGLRRFLRRFFAGLRRWRRHGRDSRVVEGLRGEGLLGVRAGERFRVFHGSVGLASPWPGVIQGTGDWVLLGHGFLSPSTRAQELGVTIVPRYCCSFL